MTEHMDARPRLHLTGASCAGVSTLAGALGEALGIVPIDVDDVFWLPTDPPFAAKRPVDDRVRLIRARQAAAEGWLIAGSMLGWGDALVEDADLIVCVETPTPVRLARLDRREALRHGARIAPGGDMHVAHLAFRDWASRYDDPDFAGRSRARHQAWLAAQVRPVLTLDGQRPTQALAAAVITRLREIGATRS